MDKKFQIWNFAVDFAPSLVVGHTIAMHARDARPECVSGSANRDRYEAIAKRLANPLMAVAMRFTHPDRALAEDLVQHAFLTGYRLYLAGSFDPSIGAYTWFSKVIAREYQSQWRKGERLIDLRENNDFLNETPSPEPDPFMLVSSQMLNGPLHAALGRLSDEYRICIELVDLANLEYAEAAKIANVPLGTLKSRLVRARLQMAALLKSSESKDD